ncbi:MAG: 3-phosphoglycerate dehydrogenase, partial [Ruminococcaceae bacterium]|nr:3-phosphoglycerate dehydrogenase [Oscillospiraceae bacterium]
CEKTLSMMKDGVRIINLSRADLVNADDMKAALASGKVASYVTDFPTEATVGVEGIINIPHLGASTYESEDNCAVMAAHELDEYMQNGNIKNSVNYPSVSIPHNGAARICLLHKNIPNVLNNITSVISEEGLNIENLSNGSKGEYAYTIVELCTLPSDKAIDALKNINGLIKLRVFA